MLATRPDGEVIANSTDIVRRLVNDFPEELGSLYPKAMSAKITAIEAEMEIEIGAYARQMAYVPTPYTLRACMRVCGFVRACEHACVPVRLLISTTPYLLYM